MTVFRNFDPRSDGVAQNAHPVVQIYPWIPNKQVSPVNDTKKLVTTNERPSWFVRRGATPGVNPMQKPGDCGCGGGIAGKGTRK